MKKLLLVAILMLALVFTVVACNNTEPADTTAGETTVGQVPGTAEPAPETEAPETPTEAPTETPTETPTEAPEVPTEPETTVDDTPATQAPVVTTEPETEAPVDPADPVYVIDAATLAGSANKNAATVELNDAGYASFTATGGDPWVLIAGNIGAMPEYMAVRYRTNTTQNGEFFLSNGANPEGGKSFEYNYNANGEWNLLIFHLPTVAPYMTDNTVGHIRFDFYTGGAEDGAFMDVEYVAFFNSAEYAQAYDFEMHKAPMWDADKSVVTHQSFDELDKYAGANKVGAVFNPGASSGWDKIVTLPDFSVDTLRYWGWIGAKGELGQFGYQINGGSAIYDDAWTHATEQPVIDAAATTGATCASRMQIMISLAGLDGENTVRALYKTADGIEVCLNEFTVILPEKPKDIKDTFISDVASNADGTDLQASDLANFFTIKYGAADPHAVIGGQYCYGGINEMFADVNGKYAYTVNMQEAANTAMMFVRGTHVVHSVDLPAVEGNLYPINNYYETDGLGRMGGAGIYAAIYGGKLNLMIKAYDDAGKVHIANKEYAIEAEGTELTMADDGETVYIMVNGKLMATIALSGSTSYDKICDLAEGVTFAQTAVVTLADGTTDTIENTLVVSTCASQIGIALRPAAMKFDSVKVQAFSAVNVPEFEKPEEPRENIALNKPVSSDSVENETNLAANATDGDEATRYGALPAGEAKMIVDLEAVYKLSSMKILFENASCEYEIAISVDGVNYTQIHKAAQHGATTLNLKDLNDAEARYIMFHRLPTDVHGSWFSIYEVYAYGEKVAEPEIPEVPSNEIKVSTTDTYTWIDVVEFTATATGNYTFTLPAGLGAWDVYACDNWAGDPYVDYYANENGAKFTIGLTEGATTTFYVAATTKADWTITWEYTEGEVEPDETEPSDLTTIEPVIGENTVTITDADMNEGAVMGTLTVDKAGQYSIVAADFMGVFYIDGIQQRGSAWLEPGTYDIALVIFAFGPGTYNYTLTVEYPPVPGEEDLPFEWDGDVTFEGAHDVWYTYTAEQDGILVITYPEGNWISGIANKTDAAYSVVVSEGETVKFNVFGNNAGTYSIKMVKFVHASKDELRVLDANGNQIGQAFAPGQCNAWSGVLFLEEGSFGSLVNWGWTALVGETFEYCVEINGELYYGDFYFEPEQGVLDAIAASGATTGSRYYVTIPADALDLGGNLIKVGVSIDGQAIHYFWEYTVVVNPAEETETNVPEVTEPAPEVTEPSEPETEEPEVPSEPEFYENLVVPQDQWVITGHNTQLNDTTNPMVAAGGVESAALLHQGSIALGEVDLSKYSKVVIMWGCDNSPVTIGHYEASANNRIMLVSADVNGTAPAEGTIIAGGTYELGGWAVKAFEIDLTGVDYNGPVYVCIDTLPGTFALFSSVEFIA